MTEGINEPFVTNWLATQGPRLAPPVRYTLIAGGHSNLTYACDDSAGRCVVLRRPPLGHVLESAHDMGREFRVISALADSKVPVPHTYGLCSDLEVNGAPFFVMGLVDGKVPHDATLANELPLTERASLGVHVAEVLAALHLTDPDSVGLGDLGRKENYVARQLKRWSQQWEQTKTDDVPSMEDALRLLGERMPLQIGASIVHGDYRLGNMIVAHGKIQALLDWELCTLGDPLADLGYLLNTWLMPDEVTGDVDDRMPTTAGGFIAREQLMQRYATLTGFDLSHINYYRAFSHWRIAAIRQGVYKRYLVGAMGASRDFDLAGYKTIIARKGALAVELLGG
ncbi:MAG: phosphotransferase family protein [Gammaproteobacteria bacterium]|nr:phosphotransferase family protein [Gammaproteobacteria bacterium]